MITINDNDLPITAAQKIITGTKPYNPPPLVQAVAMALTGETDGDTVDMYDLEDIRELAEYLMTFYRLNKHRGDDETTGEVGD